MIDDDQDQRVHEAVMGERFAVASYLRRTAAADRRHASFLLADSSQNKPDADRSDARAAILDAFAVDIELGGHWK
jgi:hypothetical protein